LPRFDIKLIKCDKQIKETYTNEELERLLKKPDINKCRFSDYRNWVMVNYLLGTGNRLKTLINLKWQEIDFHNDMIRLTTTKSRKQRKRQINPRLYRRGIMVYSQMAQYGQYHFMHG
ncbi:MAG: tyrosine-type recombinase/integrase, partial [Syntrophobacterales bacterium]|nr:tyrosine-type recombinase/integrase [Syntrophobacterales bacterium]